MCLPMRVLKALRISVAVTALLVSAQSAFAQEAQTLPNPPDSAQPLSPDNLPEPKALPETIPLDQLEGLDLPDGMIDLETGEILEPAPSLETEEEKVAAPIEQPDYSRLPESEERSVRLDALFERLQAEDNAEAANLIAEEIWAIWLDSGSASVNMLLRRGTAAQKRGDDRLARRMYNHVTELAPDYAEGWARSARLAYEEDDLSRALSEVTQALILEPRQFYAHWTLGNIFEKIGRTEEAYETYKEANRLYPELMPVKDRLEMMKGSLEGDVL